MRGAELGPRISRIVILYGLLVVAATLVAGSDVDLVVPESEPDSAVEMLMQEESVTAAASPGPAALAAKQAIQNIRDLVAYSQAANAKAIAAQKSHNSMSHSVITNTITKMAAIKPQVLAVSYAKAMGDIRKYYNVGLSKYELDHLDRAVLHSKGVVKISKETLKKGRATQTVAMLNAKKLGLMRDPDIFVKLAVPLNKFTANVMAIEKLSGNADNQVAAECVRAGIAQHYKTFLQQVKYKYKLKEKEREKSIYDAALDAEKKAFKDTGKLSSEPPAADKAVKKAMKGGRRLMSGDSGAGMDMLSKLSHSLIETTTTPQLPPKPRVSADKMKQEAAELARQWAKANKSKCSQVIEDIIKMERGQQLTPNCPEIAGKYAQGVISATKGHIRGKMAEVKLQNDDLKGAIESDTKKVCLGSATGHLINVHPGVTTATFTFDKKAKTITWSTGIVWKQQPPPTPSPTASPTAAPTPAPTPAPPSTSNLAIKGAGFCLDAAQRNKNGGLIHMWSCSSANKNQQWTYDPTTGSIKNHWSGKCLDSPQRGAAGSIVHTWDCQAGNKNQIWELKIDGHIYNPAGQTCLDSPNAGAASNNRGNGQKVRMWSCNWNKVPVRDQRYISYQSQIWQQWGKW